jgi:hypothetical protein
LVSSPNFASFYKELASVDKNNLGMVLEHTVRLLATVTTCAEVVAALGQKSEERA